MAVVGFMVFAGALTASLAVFWLTLVPALPRIVAILRDGPTPMQFAWPVTEPHLGQIRRSEPRLRARMQTATLAARPKLRAAA